MYRTRLRGVAERAIVESPSLRMSKFAQIPVKGQDPDDAKKDEVNEIVKTANRFQLVPGLDPFMDLPDSRTFTTKLCSRLIVNSAGGVLENAGLSLHRNLGYPFIPGSAVKGVARHAAWCEWHDADEADGEEEEWILKYESLQYNSMFDKNNRSDVFFPYYRERK